MHKITKKLFGYFTILLVFFAVTAFIGFWGVFRHFTFEHLTNELTDRALVIRNQLEQFLDTTPGSSHGQGQGRGAYLRFVNDIAMADAYILDADGNPFTYGRQGSAGNIPTDEILEFARPVFTESTTQSARRKSADGHKIFYVGMPVFQDGQVFLAVIIRDTADSNQESFLLAISILGICLLLVLFVSGFLSFLLSRRFIQPIQQIACTAKELANGNYQAKTNVQDPTELGELADEMDLLAKKLEQARQESSKLEQMQNNYISNISHELRTPVTVIRSSLEAVCDGIVTGEKAAEYQRQMLAECISLQRLVNDMLELSRLQNNDFPIEEERMDIQMALADAIRAVRVIAQKKSITILFEPEPVSYLMDGDYGRLRQMFIAALDNAIKYSPAHTSILVTRNIQADCLHISIKDHGRGIAKEDLAHIFERFYRCGHNRENGSGLGLAIIKNIAQRHSITVQVESDGETGTEILFHIPNVCKM